MKLPCLITSLLREFLLIPTSNAVCIVLSAFNQSALILSGLYSIFIKFALLFFLVLFLFREFFLTLLEIKIWFPHWMPPQKEFSKAAP